MLASVAVAVAAYSFTIARRYREQLRLVDASAALLSQEVRWLAQDILPTLGRRLREGATVPGALAELAQPSQEAALRLLQALGQVLEEERRMRVTATAMCSAMQSELGALAHEQLPALVESLRAGDDGGSVRTAEVTQPSQPAVRHLWEEITRELEDGNRQGATAMVACAGAAARMQAQVTSLLGRLRELQDEYGDRQDVFAHLLEADHRISQLGRLADNIALLSGGRSGRRWTKPIRMENVLRGGVGRIGGFRRVRFHSTSTAAVAGYAAEGVIHALAELLDNATRFSPHGTSVHVYVEEEDAGVIVTIEDSGLGMRTRERRLAETLISSPQSLATLSGTRLGLAAVGRLAGKYGLTVSFRPSSRGGIGVVVIIPRRLVVHLPEEEPLPGLDRPAPRDDPPPEAGEPPTGGDQDEHDAQDGRDGRDAQDGRDGHDFVLPKRPRGQTLAGLPPASAQPSAPEPDGRAAAARLAAFRRPVGARTDTAPAPPDGTRTDTAPVTPADPSRVENEQ